MFIALVERILLGLSILNLRNISETLCEGNGQGSNEQTVRRRKLCSTKEEAWQNRKRNAESSTNPGIRRRPSTAGVIAVAVGSGPTGPRPLHRIPARFERCACGRIGLPMRFGWMNVIEVRAFEVRDNQAIIRLILTTAGHGIREEKVIVCNIVVTERG